MEFQALPSRIGQVRRIVSAQLRYWHLDPLIDRVALGLSELLTNVHRHAGSDKHCTVELVLLWDRLTVSVRDHDPQLPEVRPSDTLATSGRGLALVAALSDSWGTRTQADDGGKTVWFTLPTVYRASGPRDAEPAVPGPVRAPAVAGARAGRTAHADDTVAADRYEDAPVAAAHRERRPRATHA